MKRLGIETTKLALLLTAAALTTVACGEEEAPYPSQAAVAKEADKLAQALESVSAPVLSELDTYITDSIEIDELSGGPGDANLFSAAAEPSGDPADNTGHASLPPGGPGSYIDWDDLGGDLANHRLLDEFKSDSSSFPRKVECVASSQVLSKMDLTYVAAANNGKYAYFAVQRRDNNGDAGWYWLFTKKEPKQVPGEEPCKANEFRLKYDITGPNGGSGDVLLVGHFSPSAGPMVRVFRATSDATDVPAGAAIDFESGLWAEQVVKDLVATVNTTPTAPGALGAAGVDAIKDGALLPELFAESGVPLSIFTGESVCGASFFGSVITRPSGSGGTSPDLKDLAGPAIFNFGSVEAQAEIKSLCDRRIRYDVTSVKGLDGLPITDPSAYSCAWKFFAEDGTELSPHPNDCEGIVSVPSAGRYSAEVTVTLSGDLACAQTVAIDKIAVYDPLAVTAQADPTCDPAANETYDSKATFWGTAAGGSGQYTYAWDFSGCASCSTSPSSFNQLPAESTPGSFDVKPAGETYTARLKVTDTRQDAVDESGVAVVCNAEASDDAMPFAPLKVDLRLSAAGQECPAEPGGPVMTTDGVTYEAVFSGGNGQYTFDWSRNACDTKATCTIDPSDDDFCHDDSLFVVLDDGSALCSAVQSETETYSKKTIVQASDNP